MIENPLTELAIEQLRERTSVKWRTYPADVLPLWVAEMDVPLAPPIHAVLSRALELGDTGYAAGNAYAESFRDFAADRWGWRGVDIARTAVVPDVMTGIVEILRLVTRANDAVVVTAPVYPPFYAFVTHADRRIVEGLWPRQPDGAARALCPGCGVILRDGMLITLDQMATYFPAGPAQLALAAGDVESLTPGMPIEPGELWCLVCLPCIEDCRQTPSDPWLSERLLGLVDAALRSD